MRSVCSLTHRLAGARRIALSREFRSTTGGVWYAARSMMDERLSLASQQGGADVVHAPHPPLTDYFDTESERRDWVRGIFDLRR